MRIGLIQSRGLGDILIALPIARFLFEQGHEVHWPIVDSYLASFQSSAPWVVWHGMAADRAGAFMYQLPMEILSARAEKIICLYHHISGIPNFKPDGRLASVLKFDQYKYAIANVPFREKWNLARCIVRDRNREQRLFEKHVRQERYLAIHVVGSDERRNFDVAPAVRSGYQIVEISDETDSIFDWLTVLERAGILVLIDSVFSNMVDQLMIGEHASKLFLPRSHGQVAWTPVMLGHWQYV